MNKSIKYISVLTVFLLLLQAFSVVISAAAEYDDRFAPVYTAVIGTAGVPVTLSGDGSFTVKDAEGKDVPVTFGMSSVSPFSSVSSPYPVYSQVFREGGIVYELCQFADTVKSAKADEFPTMVFSKLNIKNTCEEDYISPTVSGAVPFDAESVPESIPAGEEITVEYYTPLSPLPEGTVIDGSFDSHLAEMTARWDAYINEGFRFTSFPDSAASDLFCSDIIESAIGIEPNGVNICFSSALSLMADKNFAVPASAKEKADLSASLLTELSGGTHLILTGGIPVFEDNLEALINLKSYAYICRAKGDLASETKYIKAYSLLLSSVAKALDNTAASLAGAWECADCKGSADNLLFTLKNENFSSAAALCRWYVCSSLFSGEISLPLNSRAEKAFRYISGVSADILKPSVISESENGTVFLGRGCPASYLLSGCSDISFEGFRLSTGEILNGKITSSGNEITVSVDCEKPLAFSIGFPVFKGNIEYASCGYDNETGIVTVPEGMTDITVRLVLSPDEKAEEYAADSELEKAISYASSCDSENCTSVSKDIFDRAYESAVSARVGTNDGKKKAAAELWDAVGTLSKTVAEYNFSLPCGGQAGNITAYMIMQKFSVLEGAEDTLDRVFVGGDYIDGTFAAIYTLRRDGYTTDQMVSECDGTRTDGGFLFDFDCELEGKTDYVLCVTNETETVTLDVMYAEPGTDSLYVRESGTERIYTEAALNVRFEIKQADRAPLDTFYKKCMGTDISGYTKESVKVFNSAAKAAKNLLCTPSVTKAECSTVYENLKSAYDGLETYASDTKNIDFPIALPILIVACVFLLAGVGLTIIISNKRRNEKDNDMLK